jgi:hypothetical protein
MNALQTTIDGAVRASAPRRGAARRPVRLVFEDAFDLAGAREVLAATLLREAASVVVDLSRTRVVHDSAVAAVAAIARRSAVPVTVRGLRAHDLRLLRYLGLEPREAFAAGGA